MEDKLDQKTTRYAASAEVDSSVSEASVVDGVLQQDKGLPVHITTPLIGVLEDFTDAGQAVVSHPLAPETYYEALSTQILSTSDIGKPVTLIFNQGRADQPIVMGVIQPQALPDEPVELNYDSGVVIKSGDSRMELDPDGHVSVKGVTIQHQAYSALRLKGASVKIN
ncbi:hypothetical protein KDW99_01410 [Marinomonas rhizomae]|uniref:DUF6484 domain-containing protein n=1 Tax=Marinomonas rhizomae TaxID=491948 RepID=UPI0021067F8E|nr:DUF6484 domain-containing protein [Marinomonas rhizomae]UTV99834.1 hypothetical protein KDW99_01410 [Marinomonas rhizomae]